MASTEGGMITPTQNFFNVHMSSVSDKLVVELVENGNLRRNKVELEALPESNSFLSP